MLCTSTRFETEAKGNNKLTPLKKTGANKSTLSKVLTSYRASERQTQLHHSHNSFLCSSYPRVEEEHRQTAEY